MIYFYTIFLASIWMKHRYFFFLVFFIFINTLKPQSFTDINNLYHSYPLFQEGLFKDKFVKYETILPLIDKIKEDDRFTLRLAGRSLQGRDISLIKYGNGNKKVFLWSQMHGDEPTATMAIFDIFNFLRYQGTEFKELRDLITEKLSLYFLPMLNPDGAEQFKRRSALDIDINRDALRMTTPEAQILSDSFDSIKADFGFNLHDQNYLSTAGQTYKQATISFLAPAFDHEKNINSIRGNAIRLISELTFNLSIFIPGHIGKYSDDFEPRAFGDNFQSRGTSTILIESGGWKNDANKMFIRKLNFLILLNAFSSIATENYLKFDFTQYNNLPFNDEVLYDLVLRNILVRTDSTFRKIDLGISRGGNRDNSSRLSSGVIEIGDLSTRFGLDEFDLTGHVAEPVALDQISFFESEEEIKKDIRNGNVPAGSCFRTAPNPVQQPPGKSLFVGIKSPLMEEKSIFSLGNRTPLIFKNGEKKQFLLINGYLFKLLEFPNEIN